ncbi:MULTISPECIES: zinc-binding alcohol dehydrogenase family protein [Acinetobacter calcoaceticus/baumannii complex]|uniref:zinc-binding alcohol dehydrogenase family protein n=1 Tax=Acinetobacter calcoaceticus/baumannii complex TaxID=909768 RepID=UPI000450C9A1|nr:MULTISPECIES: zinc-binding alcohol dehydrogenase family protein [Acinetobacter calcoaceticus/baumannii complex]AJB49518.1 Zn-dependent oxidoreductase [Acinetobacter nosocomialis]EXE77559.1 zinc-binding alcohol dehydrogenase family protein [Acinetobacter sp. 1566109]MBJ9959710.1 zinc-binding alcohol dehydrogenase family protein [Acinetobacter nosocomialis]MBR7739294.1 zinc-binding alcohol dehydrogenase family protein [Acinetobacter nosocomialis]MBR7750164.1 zinc-binding alcohol dehydrogenase
MKAVAYQKAGPITSPESLVDIELDTPVAKGHDLLVRVQAISVNPVDTKIRKNISAESGWKVLGWDAVGTVEAIGDKVTQFRVGDVVWYAGALNRQGSNSELQLVDERIVGHKPKILGATEAAALPLTAITAWEMLFDRLQVPKTAPANTTILVIGGAGGVGSITIQLLKQLTNLTIITTASRPETKEWVEQLGADYVLDHREPLAPQIKQLGLNAPSYVFSTTQTDQHLSDIVELIAPQGHFGLIDDPEQLDIKPFKSKSVSVHWEFMFTRSMFQTEDMQKQSDLLNEVSKLVDEGKIKTTVTEVLSPINAENLKRVHQQIESGTTKGKIVLQGF